MKAIVLNRLMKFSIGVLTLVYLGSCNDNSYKENAMAQPVDLTEEFEVVQTEFKSNTPKDLKIIKSAKVRYKVKKVQLATEQIKQITAQHEGYISDMRFDNNLYNLENRFTIKVPNCSFDNLLDSISKVAEFIEYENITTKDVTEEFIDIEARLKTKLEVKERYETILKENAKTVKDILATEEKLRVLQEEIESAQGRIKYLSNKIAYSTIQVDLYETVNYKEEPSSYEKSFWSRGKDGLVFGWNFVENVVLAIIHIWPLLIIGAIIFFLVRNRRIQKRKNP
nr:DUF4349 domain-containing protein [Allomuricauda sp.]